jgi:hypothetical protein
LSERGGVPKPTCSLPCVPAVGRYRFLRYLGSGVIEHACAGGAELARLFLWRGASVRPEVGAVRSPCYLRYRTGGFNPSVIATLSETQVAALYSFCWAGGLAALCWWLSRLPEDHRAFRVTAKAIDSWFLSARWSAEPRSRLRRMAVVAGLLAVFMLYVLITDPPPRYSR